MKTQSKNHKAYLGQHVKRLYSHAVEGSGYATLTNIIYSACGGFHHRAKIQNG